ncbi:M20 family metallopeptidase [Brevibacillus sp. B_LB10_24]|uniref:M20 family metallopeptidase n=1 Tax=Brevibacillus sp. B_LB10_24 TaxID=3380645 RepID=UPI0038BA0546
MQEETLVALISDLIRMENTHPAAINKSAEYCANWLSQRGVQAQLRENRGLKMVVASCSPAVRPRASVILNGHLDVVPGSPADFVPRLEGGKLFGRGSYDMLGAVAVMMMLTAELAKNPLGIQVVLKLVPDEEQGGELGTGYLVDNGVLGDFVICGEPTNLGVAVQAKGVLQLEIESTGEAAHGSRPWLGKNAILQAMEDYRSIASLDFLKASSPYFSKPSFNLAKIQGGGALNQVPDSCAFHLDIRYLPNQNPEELVEQVRRAVPNAAVRVVQHGAPVQTDEHDKHVQQLLQAAEEVTKTKVRVFGQDGSADTRFYAKHAIPAVEFGPAGANHHGPDEHVEIASLMTYHAILQQFIKRLGRKEGSE